MYEYGEEEVDPRRQRLKLVAQAVLGILILAAVIGGLYFYHQRYGISSEERFDREVAEDRSVAIALEPMRRLFPYEYSRLRQTSAEFYNLEKKGRVIDRIPGDFLKNFVKRHAVEGLQGGDKQTLAFIASYGALFAEADKDPALCDLLFGYEDKMADAKLVFASKPLTTMFAAYAELASSGRKNPVKRAPASLADIDAFRREYRKLDPNPKPMFRASPEDQCKRANLTVQSIRALPDEQEIRLISVVLQFWR